MPDFLVATEQGVAKGQLLAQLAKLTGMSPREALRDPDLPFNATVLRARQKYRQLRFDLTMARCTTAEQAMLAALRLIYEDD